MCRRLVTGLVLCASLSLTSCWSQVGFGPDRTGHNPFERTIGTGNVAALVPKWSARLGLGIGNPIVSERSVFVSALTSGTRSEIFSLRRSSGATRWSIAYDGLAEPPDVAAGALTDDRLYVGVIGTDPPGGGQTRDLVAYDRQTGDELWRSMGGEGPAVVGETVYSGWLRVFPGGGRARGIVVRDAGGEPTFASAHNTGDGGVSPPAVKRGFVFQAFGSSLEVYDATGGPNCTGDTTGTFRQICFPVWTASTGGEIVSTPMVGPGAVYVRATGGWLYAFDRAGCGRPACRRLWRASTGGAGGSSPAHVNGVVYIGSDDGRLYAFDADGCGAPACPPLWTATTGGPIHSSPALANGVVYVGSDDGRLYAFDAAGCGAATCPPLWSFQTGGPVRSSPAISDGRIYVGSGDGNLYAFGLP